MQLTRRALVAIVTALMIVSCGSPEERAARYLERARALYEAGDFVRAELEVRNSLQIKPESVEARYLYARISEGLEKWPEMAANLELTLELDPEYMPALLDLGNLLVASELLEEARARAAVALALAPEESDAHVLQARVYAMSERWEEAASETAKALELDPANAEAMAVRTGLYARDDAAAALAYLDTVLESSDDPTNLKELRVVLLARLQRWDEAAGTYEELVSQYPERDDYRYRLAEVHTASGNISEAEEALRGIVAAEPDNIAARLYLSEFLVSYRNTDAAIETLKSFRTENPDEYRYALAMGRLYERDDRLDEALQIYSVIVAEARELPAGLEARTQIAAIHAAQDELDLAQSLVGEVLELEPANTGALLLDGGIALTRREYDRAVASFRSVLRHDPTSTRAQLLLARAHLSAGEPALAREAYERLLVTEPGQRNAVLELARLHTLTGALPDAVRLLAEYHRSAPRDRQIGQALFEVLLRQGDWAAAERIVDHLATLPADAGLSEFLRGQLRQAQARPDEAAAEFELAVEENAFRPAAFAALALLRGQAGDIEGQIGEYERGLEANPGEPQLVLLLGSAYQRAGRIDEAINLYERVLSMRPDFALASNNLASLLADYRSDDRASLERALELASRFGETDVPPYLDTLGWVYYRLGDYEAALPLLERAVAAAGPSPELNYHLGMTYLRLERTSEALAALETATAPADAAYPGIEEARAALARLSPASTSSADQG